MGMKAITHYMDDRADLSRSDSHAMIILADWANDQGECWPGMEAIARRLRITKRAAQKQMQRLEEAGELLIIPNDGPTIQGGRTNRFVLLSFRKSVGVNLPDSWKKLAENRRKQNAENGKKSPTAKAENLQRGELSSARSKGRKRTQRGGSERAKGAEALPPKPSLNPNNIHPDGCPSGDGCGPDGKSGQASKQTDQQQLFGKVCDIVGWDHNTLDKSSKGQVAQTVGVLVEAGYTLEDLNRFGREVWALDWRWTQYHQRPTLKQLRQEIGKLRAKAVADATMPTSPRLRMRVLA